MKIEIKVVMDTDDPNDKELVEQVIDIVDELKDRLDDRDSKRNN